MEESAQWGLALLVGIPIAVALAWFNKSGADFKDGFEQKKQRKRRIENGMIKPKFKWFITFYVISPLVLIFTVYVFLILKP